MIVSSSKVILAFVWINNRKAAYFTLHTLKVLQAVKGKILHLEVGEPGVFHTQKKLPNFVSGHLESFKSYLNI